MAAKAPMSLRVGASKTIGEYVAAPNVERFLRAHPEAEFSLLVDNTQALLAALEAGRLDFVLIEGFFDSRKYESRTWRREEFFSACAPPGTDWPGGRWRWTSWRASGSSCERRVRARARSSRTRCIEKNRTLAGFPGVVTISDFAAIKSLVADGLGVSFLYAPVVRRELERGSLARFDIEDMPMSGSFSFVCLRDNLFAASWADWML